MLKQSLISAFVVLACLPLEGQVIMLENPPPSTQTGAMVGPGNSINFNFNSAQIGGGVPPEWSATSTAISVGSSTGLALWFTQQFTPSTSGCITEFDVIVASSALAEGKAISVGILKAHGDIGTALRNWRIYLKRSGGSLVYIFVLGEDTNQLVYQSQPIQVGTLVRHRVEYNILSQSVIWSVNGVVIASAPMTGLPQNTETHIFGSSGSSDGRDTMFLFGRVRWENK